MLSNLCLFLLMQEDNSSAAQQSMLFQLQFRILSTPVEWENLVRQLGAASIPGFASQLDQVRGS
jgi:hypothetical protein